MIPQIEVQIQISFSPLIQSPFQIRVAFSVYLCCVISSLYLALKQEGCGFNFVWSCNITRNIQIFNCQTWRKPRKELHCHLYLRQKMSMCESKFKRSSDWSLSCFTRGDRAWIHQEWLHEEESGVSMLVWHSVQYSALKLTPSADNSD